jgi:hypothetical protein
MNSTLDLAKIFQAVSDNLWDEREALNEADHYNNDHGDHMVEIFEVIAGALENTSGENLSQGFSKASEVLSGQESGSAEVYARGLSQAADHFQDREFDSSQALPLLMALLGGGKADLKESAGGLLENLVGQLGGSDGLDVGDLLRAGGAFLQSKGEGDSNLEAAVDALITSSTMGEEPYRAQSSRLVADTMLSYLMKSR